MLLLIFSIETVLLYVSLKNLLWILLFSEQFPSGSLNDLLDSLLQLQLSLSLILFPPRALLDNPEHIHVSKLQVLFRPESLLLSLLSRVSTKKSWCWLLSEYVLDREDLVEELELLLRDLFVRVIDGLPVEVSDVLETVDNEGFQRFAVEDFVVNDD